MDEPRKKKPRKKPLSRPSGMSDAEYKGIDSALRRIQSRKRFSKTKQMRLEHDWPPEEAVLKRWKHQGIECVVGRGSIALCGYIAVPKGHPWYGIWHADIPLEIHGGLSFACRGTKDRWWLGWDYGHDGDWIGFYDPTTRKGYDLPGRIWTVDDVSVECERAVTQALSASKK